ncbi:sodium:proton antiporter [Picosynechococcus sp. PCC 11901]|uniref:cation:proton antiporter domain-containing protein n=1 Tax=Picosynechococcus sp. PCC 11901 TaxID=2579791 RepID=UPI0010FBDAB5|nr:cation:proton antiporter [Picosynechococcus sp. PCC 11901]QCS48928.1 sodium:proton antiporter [Picosynechococcus sp. PCC 11901]
MVAESIQYITENPIFTFILLLLVSLTIPPIFERLNLPGLVGLLFAGIILGENALGLLNSESETMVLFSEVGKIYLMFVAGLEINLAEFRKTQDRSIGFGFLTFIVPLTMGTVVGLSFDFGWNAAILIGSLLASHTLLGYPILNRLGILNNESVTVTIGATIFTDIAALLVLAICVSIHQGDFSTASLVLQLALLVGYGALVLFGLSWLGREFFQRNGDEEGNQFLFILLAVFLASVGAQVINVDKIVGAFLAGLAVNDVVGKSPVEEKIEFVGSTLFIPFFFVGMGLLLDIPAFINNLLYEFPLTFSIVGGLLLSKFIAAAIAKQIYRYSWAETLTMWSLSIPQVAATLAAALVGFRVGLISESVFNAVIVLMLVTSMLGPVLTRRFGRLLPSSGKDVALAAVNVSPSTDSFKIVVPIANPSTKDYLLEAAGLLTRIRQGIVMPVSIVTGHAHMDDPAVMTGIDRSQRLLQEAIAQGEQLQITMQPKIRIDDDVAAGISRVAREENANLILMGWGKTEGLKARLLGTLVYNVCWSAHCPVAVVRLLDDPKNLRRIMVPFKGISAQNLQIVQFAELLAIANQAEVTVFHVCETWMTKDQRNLLKADLENALQNAGITTKMQIRIIRYHDVAKAVLHDAKDFDLVILHSTRYRTAGGLAVGDVTTKISSQIQTSVVIFNEL